MHADFLLRHRDVLASLPAIALLAILATTSMKQLAKLKDATSEPLTISLYEEPAPEPPPPEPPRPQVTERREMPPPAPEPAPRPVAPLPVDAPPSTPAALPAPPAAVASPAPQPLQRAVPPTPAPVAAPEGDAPPPSRSIEAGYVGALRAYLESIKRYPTSREARLQHPQGRVRLWLEVARDGTLRAAGIDESSGSMILDGAAVATVRQGRYPAFPAEAWRGAEMHRFAVTLEYKLDA